MISIKQSIVNACGFDDFLKFLDKEINLIKNLSVIIFIKYIIDLFLFI